MESTSEIIRSVSTSA